MASYDPFIDDLPDLPMKNGDFMGFKLEKTLGGSSQENHPYRGFSNKACLSLMTGG